MAASTIAYQAEQDGDTVYSVRIVVCVAGCVVFLVRRQGCMGRLDGALLDVSTRRAHRNMGSKQVLQLASNRQGVSHRLFGGSTSIPAMDGSLVSPSAVGGRSSSRRAAESL